VAVIPPVIRRTFHRNGYTLHDSAGGPPRRPGRAPSPGSAQAARHDAPGGSGARSIPVSPRRSYRRPVASRRAGTEMQQCNPQCGCSWGRCPQPVCHQPEATGYVRRDRRIAVWRRVGVAGSSVRRRVCGRVTLATFR
jgi:hypothetical protein